MAVYKFQAVATHTDAAARLESFRGLKLSSFESVRALKLSRLESIRVLIYNNSFIPIMFAVF